MQLVLARNDIGVDECETLSATLDALATTLRGQTRVRAVCDMLRLSLIDIRAQLERLKSDMGGDVDALVRLVRAVFEESPKRAKLIAQLRGE